MIDFIKYCDRYFDQLYLELKYQGSTYGELKNLIAELVNNLTWNGHTNHGSLLEKELLMRMEKEKDDLLVRK